jgi:hypothetical protein
VLHKIQVHRVPIIVSFASEEEPEQYVREEGSFGSIGQQNKKSMPIKYVIGSIGIFIRFTKQRSRHNVGKNEKEKRRQVPNWNGPAVASTRATWKLASHWRVGSLYLFQVQRQADTGSRASVSPVMDNPMRRSRCQYKST